MYTVHDRECMNVFTTGPTGCWNRARPSTWFCSRLEMKRGSELVFWLVSLKDGIANVY